MDWNALIGALIGAGIPATLVYVGLHRQRQSADAEAFGPAVLVLDRVNPDRLTINLIPDPVAEAAMLADLQQQINVARERLLVVSAGNPRSQVRTLARIAEVKLAAVFHGTSWAVRDLQAHRDNPEWMAIARERHAEAVAAMESLIEANFAWTGFDHGPRAIRSERMQRRSYAGSPLASSSSSGPAGGNPREGRQPTPVAHFRSGLAARAPRYRGEHGPGARPAQPHEPGAPGTA
jgi:hypothetical protein